MLSGAHENALPLFANGKMSPPTTAGGTESAAKGSALRFCQSVVNQYGNGLLCDAEIKVFDAIFWQLSKAFNILAPGYILKKRKVMYLKYSASNSQPFHLGVAITCQKPSNLHHLNLCTVITALYCRASPLT